MNTDPHDSLSGKCAGEPGAEAVAAYLEAHPEFFVGRDDLLAKLTLPHESGRAISLLERQVTLLRERNSDLNRHLGEFIGNAQTNDSLFEKTRLLVLELLKAESLGELAAVIRKEITKLFGATESLLIFAGEQAALPAGIQGMPYSEAQEIFGELFEKRRTFCGELNERQVNFLFPAASRAIVSAAIVPLHVPGETAAGERPQPAPLLVIGSATAGHFNNSQDTLFVDFIGEVLSALILKLRQA